MVSTFHIFCRYPYTTWFISRCGSLTTKHYFCCCIGYFLVALKKSWSVKIILHRGSNWIKSWMKHWFADWFKIQDDFCLSVSSLLNEPAWLNYNGGHIFIYSYNQRSMFFFFFTNTVNKSCTYSKLPQSACLVCRVGGLLQRQPNGAIKQKWKNLSHRIMHPYNQNVRRCSVDVRQ